MNARVKTEVPACRVRGEPLLCRSCSRAHTIELKTPNAWSGIDSTAKATKRVEWERRWNHVDMAKARAGEGAGVWYDGSRKSHRVGRTVAKWWQPCLCPPHLSHLSRIEVPLQSLEIVFHEDKPTLSWIGSEHNTNGHTRDSIPNS